MISNNSKYSKYCKVVKWKEEDEFKNISFEITSFHDRPE